MRYSKSEIIRALRTRFKRSRETSFTRWVTKETGLSHSTYYNWQSGKTWVSNPSYRKIINAARLHEGPPPIREEIELEKERLNSTVELSPDGELTIRIQLPRPVYPS